MCNTPNNGDGGDGNGAPLANVAFKQLQQVEKEWSKDITTKPGKQFGALWIIYMDTGHLHHRDDWSAVSGGHCAVILEIKSACVVLLPKRQSKCCEERRGDDILK